MDVAVFQVLLAFIEGFLLILSPCILPILPILLAGGISGGKLRPLGIILGFVLTFSAFTLLVHVIIHYTHVNLDYVRNIAYFLLIIFGLIMMSDFLFRKFSQLTKSFMTIQVFQEGRGFWSGFLLGMLISIIWTPCAGPILATAIVQVAIQKSLTQSFLILLFFALGCVIPMTLIVLLGRTIIQHFKYLQQHAVFLRKLLGLIIILSVFAMMQGNFANLSYRVNKNLAPEKPAQSLLHGLAQPYPAPLLQNISAWINSSPLTIADLKGKVVLVDFWAYSCINCVRTIPYLIDWYKKYHKDGLIIIGVHTPEFEFEKNLNNVKKAVEKYGIPYPIALDNNYKTWLNYRNLVWPSSYLINQRGEVVYVHLGEGSYDVTENNIRYLLGKHTPVKISYRNPISFTQTPETYLGYGRMANFASQQTIATDKVGDYRFPTSLQQNEWALQGKWLIQRECIIAAQANARIQIRFKAKNVYAVMGSITHQPIAVKLLLNNLPIKPVGGGGDKLQVSQYNLYELLQFDNTTNGVLELISDQPGLEIYTFTFGS